MGSETAEELSCSARGCVGLSLSWSLSWLLSVELLLMAGILSPATGVWLPSQIHPSPVSLLWQLNSGSCAWVVPGITDSNSPEETIRAISAYKRFFLNGIPRGSLIGPVKSQPYIGLCLNKLKLTPIN